MEPFIVDVCSGLDQLGALRSLSGTLPVEGYDLGGQRFATPGGVSYELQLTNTGEGILLSGTATATLRGACARCLEPVEEQVEGSVEGYYLLDADADATDYEQDEYDCVGEDGTVDLSGPIQAALSYETPFVMLCSDDCAGLCPHCGANLNEGPCACADDDGIDPDNPFAVLKNLNFDGE